jgi:GntR family transcriptional regulator, transcriptional repressor for pyruvate dehydrogenase complex
MGVRLSGLDHMSVKPIQRASAAEKVFDALYEMMTSGQLKPDQKLPSQDELARQFGVSRNTLREAVHKLSAMGLLVSRQGVGTVVRAQTPESYLSTLGSRFLFDPLSVREFIEARICIERTLVRLCVRRAGAREILEMRKNLKLQEKAVIKNDPDAFTGHDIAFHNELARLSGNRVLLKFLQTTNDMLYRFINEVTRLPGAIETALRFHARILAAMKAKDADLAEKEMVLHLHDVVRRIESNIHIDLAPETLCGFDLIYSASKNPAAGGKEK